MKALLRVRPWWVRASLISLSALAVSTAIQTALFQFGARPYFLAFLPAVFLAGLLAGTPAAAIVVVLTVPLVWWAFMPPVFEFNPLIAAHVDAIAMFLFLSGLLIFLAEVCREIIALQKAAHSQALARPVDR